MKVMAPSCQYQLLFPEVILFQNVVPFLALSLGQSHFKSQIDIPQFKFWGGKAYIYLFCPGWP